MTVLGGIGLVVAAFGAGAANAVAGGGTLLTFPALVALGLPPIVANATNTVGLVPGSLGGAFGYRQELKEVRGWLVWLLPSSLLGGGLGALLLLVTPPRTFERLVPLLVLGATALFALAGPLGRRLGMRLGSGKVPRRRALAVAAMQLAISIYGGYFGAGMGILMLAALGLLSLGSLHEANGLKSFAAAAINAVAAGVFLAKGLVVLAPALLVVTGSTLGGYLGAGFARQLGARRVRALVIVVGLVAAGLLARRAYF